ncbi:hypothetical protein PHMEG_00028489 [Phytophthora megakarya]|uniref:Uncharacterized protein n=1 Tax=Phytophthora megakarya TaxID=4795 RepID=A0A225V618_9STRA|nr:hypothetical protein PHMEG_00028489 [Phytophthora megakarya]
MSDQNLAPFRSFVPRDLPSTNTRKRLSDFRFVMLKIEAVNQQNGTYHNNPSLDQAREMLRSAMTLLRIGDQTECSYTRRKEQLLWSSVVNLLRRHCRLGRVNTSQMQLVFLPLMQQLSLHTARQQYDHVHGS